MYPQVFGKYVLERELSRGGMARVLLATLRGAGGFEKKLVVKQIRDELAFDQQFVRRFVEEAKTTVALSHPNIVPVYELGQEQGTFFLAMELVEGLCVADMLRERNEDGTRRVLTPEEGAYLGMEVCRALDYAHRRMKVVHRDITPRNVMIDEEGQVKLIDFGIAAPARVAGHEILGSPGHMPPEQVDGKELGPATDIFALAVLLMEAWTGSAPFRRATPEECDAAMREPHKRPSDFDKRLAPLDDAIGRAMRLDPKERQQDAAALGRELRTYLQGVDTSDIARALGDRVREFREASSAPSRPSTDGAKDEVRAPNPSAGDLGTRTFAAREEVEWKGSRPPEDEIPGASTRKLTESIPASSEAPRAGKKDPAMAIPTPLMVEPAGELPPLPPTVRKKRFPRPSEEPETIATRPLETPVSRKSAAPPAAAARSRSWVGLALVGVALAGGVVVWRTRTGGPAIDKPSPPPSATTTTAPVATEIAVKATASTSAPVPPIAVSLAPAVLSATTASPSGSTIDKAAGKATVSLVGDPGTRVSVDGVSRGACPVRLQLEPGQHEARFTFDPTGESRGERVSVKAGEKVTVRAEFTGATPTVRIYR